MINSVRLQLHGALYRPDSFVMMLRYCSKLKAIRYELNSVRLQLHGALYRPDSFVMMLRYCSKLKAIRYESTNLNRIVADKSHRVTVA